MTAPCFIGDNMVVVIKLVNVHFNIGYNKVKWSFQTVYDDVIETRRYNIITDKRTKEVSKELGNKLFRFIQKHYPERKVVVVIDKEDEECVQYVRVVDHYEIRVAGTFVESCDSLHEAREAKGRWQKAIKGC